MGAKNYCFILLLLFISACHEEPIAPDNTTLASSMVKTGADDQIPQAQENFRLLKADDFITKFGRYQDQLIVVGEFTRIGGIGANRIAAYDGNGWRPLGDGLPQGCLNDLQEYQGELYVTGSFASIGGTKVNNLARWDGNTWKPVVDGMEFFESSGDMLEDWWYGYGGWALEVHEGELFIGGGNIKGDRVALFKWDGNNIESIENRQSALVWELKKLDNTLYGAANINGTTHLSQFDENQWVTIDADEYWWKMEIFQEKLFSPAGIWDDSQLIQLSYPIPHIRSIKSMKERLYILGKDHKANASQIYRYDGHQWESVLSFESGIIYDMVEFQGTIFIGGDFVD